MKKIVILSFILLIGVFSFSYTLNEFNEPSTFSRAIGGAIYPLYEGAQCITYNPAGMANGKDEAFFSHTEHFLGVIRNEFLSMTFKVKRFSFGASIQYTYPTDEELYNQYKLTFGGAYKFQNYSLGAELNAWNGSDIREGHSLDIGTILKFNNVNFSLTAKNLFASITWNSSPLEVERYSPEFVMGAAYFGSKFTASSYLNLSSKEFGIGTIFPVTDFLQALAGYKMTLSKSFSKELSFGMRISYYDFILDLSYVFKDAFKYGDSISPFYISLTYDFTKGV